MRLLICFWLFIAAVTACAPGGALTPADAFSDLGTALTRDDASAVLKLLSSESRVKINEMCLLISGMPGERRAAIASGKGLRADALDAMSPERYVFVFFLLKKNENPVVNAFLKNRIVSVKREADRAVLILDNGMELPFVKEGPYWKFNIEGV